MSQNEFLICLKNINPVGLLDTMLHTFLDLI